jgi:tetratricopeptide (TPR) repeat protein
MWAMKLRQKIVVVCVLLCLGAIPSLGADNQSGSALDTGYRNMYNLQFGEAHKVFQQWQQEHPDDPLGPVSDAAAYLFSEFDRLHILESELFVRDQTYENRSRLVPNAQVKQAFEAQLSRSKQLAQQALGRDPNDANAMFASVLTSGLQGDYLALIEKRDMQALKVMKEGRATAERLLALNPTFYDAYLAIGVENYLLSQKPAPVRWILHISGAETDKAIGIQKLRITAEKGRYLLPYARLLLAVAALRDNDRIRARELLQDLAANFPRNHLYRSELAKLQQPVAASE